MTKEDIIRKLTSRKFWIALAGFITPLLLAFGVTEHTTTQIVAIIMAGADVIVYLFAEGKADAAGAAFGVGELVVGEPIASEYASTEDTE